jgi:peptidoglycan/LPS O-acetylase OafA/YrhL
MGRTILTQLLLFFAPFAIYALVLYATQRDARGRENWPAKVVASLAIAGCALVIAGLFFFAHFGGSPTSGVYEPARYEDGKLIPGRIK